MDRQNNESSPAPTADVITQREMASQLIFQNAEYPPRTSLLERFRNGAQLEPGPLTIVQPYFDFGPFIVPTSEGTKRAEQIRQSIRAANAALGDAEGHGSATEFSRRAHQIANYVWQTVQERRNASLHARNWTGLRSRVRDELYACQVSCMLWTASKCVAYRFRWLGEKAFGVASERATALACISLSA